MLIKFYFYKEGKMSQELSSVEKYFEKDLIRRESRKNMFQVLDQKEEFILIGLTGRLGSGCSEFANILTSDFDDIIRAMTWPTPGPNGFPDNSGRELRILARYADSHWQKFNIIRGRDIITSFLVESENNKFTHNDNLISNIMEMLCQHTAFGENRQYNFDEDFLKNILKQYYSYSNDNNRFKDRRKVIEECDRELEAMALARAISILREHNGNTENFINWLKRINEGLRINEFNFDLFVYCTKLLPALSDYIKGTLKSKEYTRLFQEYGNQIRRYGCIQEGERLKESESGIFAWPKRLNQYIKVLRHPFSKEYHRPVRIVIDSIKNPLEALYLRSRYSAFTLIAVSANEVLRKKWLSSRQLTQQEISQLDWNEYPDIGHKKYMIIQNLIDKENFGTLDSEELENKLSEAIKKEKITQHVLEYWKSCDDIRREAYNSKQYMFFLQDVGSCIQTADIYISNDAEEKVKHSLTVSAIRTVMLLIFPGLLQPTPIERCMQIAYSAKHNSGCLSRQVGAVVTDNEFNILSLGWNDVPCGDISCSMKNMIDLCADQDRSAYTDYELNSPKFDEIKSKYEFHAEDIKKVLQGLPLRYCFKSLENENIKDPMRARAMHAEEKALNLCGEHARGGFLFTTSSPCEMCSKNAKNHRISRIYYIEPYPGDAEYQYTQSGLPENRAQHILYTGAVGRAYTQMYSQIMPFKDIIKTLGAPECFKIVDGNICANLKTDNNTNNKPTENDREQALPLDDIYFDTQKTSERR